MEVGRAQEIMQQFVDGVNPYTDERFPPDSPYQQADTVRALHLALNGLTKLRRSTTRNTGPGRAWTDYVNDELGRRTAIARFGTAFGDTPVTDSYGYNLRSEVTSARRTLSADPAQAIPGFSHDYAYDPIGNRIAATNNQEAIAYVANSLNQYTAVNETEPVYDDDGNLLYDGRFDYTWNGENRLVMASNATHVVSYAYDHQGRMVWKQVAGSDAPTKTITYTWDDFNIVAETICTPQSTIRNYNIWGLDLSQSLQGAGGVGGLLAVISPLPLGEGQGEGSMALACYDANGNITEYVSTNGTIAAHYEYSPFGEIAFHSGSLSTTFTHRFSTKPWCATTALSEYEYRKYCPSLGRWLSRDPIGETGGINLTSFINNSPIVFVDSFGLAAPTKPSCCCCCPDQLYVVDKGIVVPPDQDAWLRAYHAIDVGIHLRWKGGRDEPKFCQLIWREGILWRTEFAKPPHWNPDFRVVYPSGSVDNESTTFDNWVKRKNETQICPGENFSPIHLKDSASIMGFYAKLVVVQVSIEAPEGCECSPKKKEICFEFGLYRDSNSGVRNHLVKSHFKIFDCSNLAQHHHPSRIFPY